MPLSQSTFRLRLWLSDRLFALATWVMPEHRYAHQYSEDGETITIWREPVKERA